MGLLPCAGIARLIPMTKLLPLFLAGSLALAQSFPDQYQATADKIIKAAMEDDAGLARLQYLCDRIGNRLGGSASLEKAIQWTAEEMKRAGLQNVQTPPVKVPHWVRGKESATLLTPLQRPIVMLGLGNSVGTPPEGITAEVIAVSNFDELTALGRDKVKGKIVLYNAVYEGYGKTVQYRTGGASRAAALGAVAMLVRSITPISIRSPHTGTLVYDAAQPKIPAAAVTMEDAESLARLYQAHVPVTVKLSMEARMLPDAESHNVFGEIRGREKPEEIVVLGGHMDSWDVGQGAQDDGSGIMASLEAVALLKKLNLQPRRTIRVVGWTNEENGGAGGEAYRRMLGDQIKNHVAAIEMDDGAEKPVGFGFSNGGPRRRRGDVEAPDPAFPRVAAMGKLLESIQAGTMSRGGGGSDISPLMADGVPGFGVETVGTHYFDWHHTEADTFDKINPRDFRLNTAALAVLSYVLAEMPERLSEWK